MQLEEDLEEEQANTEMYMKKSRKSQSLVSRETV